MAVRVCVRALVLATTVLCSGLASPALAQTSDFPQRFVNPDEFGVDVSTGKYVYARTEGSIGSGSGELSVQRVWSGTGWQDNLAGKLNRTQDTSGRKITLAFGVRSVSFHKVGSAFVADNADGGTLVEDASGTQYTYTTSGGTEYLYNNPQPGPALDGVMPKFCENVSEQTCFLLPATRKTADGVLTTFEWNVAIRETYLPRPDITTYRQYARLTRVYDNAGSEVLLTYASGTIVGSSAWLSKASVQFKRAADSTAASSTTYSYPTSGTTVTDADGGVWTYMLDSSGRLASIQSPNETTPGIVITYNTAGRIIKVVKDGVTRNYVWSTNSSGQTVLATTGDTQGTVVSQPSTSQPVTTYDSAGNTVQNSYDASGRLTQTVYPEGDKIAYQYDTRGNVTQATASAKPGSGKPDLVTSASYLACFNAICNRPAWTKDAAGFQTDYTYDPVHGQAIKVELPAATSGGPRPTTIISYTSMYGQIRNSTGTLVTAPTPQYKATLIRRCSVAAECDGTGNETRTTIAYNASLMPASVTVAAGNLSVAATTTYEYATNNQVSAVDGPLAGTVDKIYYAYTTKGALKGITLPDPDGSGPLLRRMERYIYRGDGQIESTIIGTTSVTDLSSYTTLQEQKAAYDGYGRKSHDRLYAGPAATGTLTMVIQYSYNSAGRLECTATRMNPAVFASLPASACTLSTQGSAGPDRISRTVYDGQGRPVSVTNGYGTPAAATEMLAYTANGKVAYVQDAMNNRTTYSYDAYDRAVKAQYPVTTVGAQAASTSDYEDYDYDARGLLTSVRDRAGGMHTLAYDQLGRMTSKSSPNSEPARTIAYDLFDRPTSIQLAGDSVAHSFTYDALGRGLTATNALGTISYQYDIASRRTRMTWPDGFYVGYDYDNLGDMTAIRENGAASGVGVLATFAYDSLGRRTSLTHGNGAVQTYGFDTASRLASLGHDLAGTANDVTSTYSYNSASQIASTDRTTNAYAWTPTTRNWNYTANGLNQLTQADTVALGYDARGNLTSSGSDAYSYSSENMMTSGPNGTSLAYDPLGRLRSLVSGTTNRRFLYDGLDLVGEYDAAGAMLNRYVHGPSVDEPLVSYEGSGTTDRRFLLADERGSIVAVTDSSGAVLATNSYDEFGVPNTATNIGRFQYTGQTWLAEIGLYYYKARMYSASLGRFMQTDPIGYADGMNWYNYVGGDPVNKTDPTGTDTATVTGPSCHGQGTLVIPGNEQGDSAGWYCAISITNLQPRMQIKPTGGGGGTPEERRRGECNRSSASNETPVASTISSIAEGISTGADALAGIAVFIPGGQEVALAAKGVSWGAQSIQAGANLYIGHSTGNYSAFNSQLAGLGTSLLMGQAAGRGLRLVGVPGRMGSIPRSRRTGAAGDAFGNAFGNGAANAYCGR